jgi:hypothetical protein
VQALIPAAWVEPRSTLPLALLRLALPLLCWAEFGNDLLPFRSMTGGHLAISAAFWLSSAWSFAGWGGRTGPVTFAFVLGLMTFVLGENGYEPDWGHHHTTLLAYVAAYLTVSSSTDHLSVDRWLELRRSPGAPAARGQTVALGLIGLQVSTVYFWGGFEKLNAPFLDGTRLTQLWVSIWTSSDWWFPLPATLAFAAASVAVVLLEFGLAFGLWVPRLRPWGCALGAAMHAAFYVLLPVGTFSLTMVWCYLAYFDPDDVEDVVRRLLGPPVER